MLSLIAKRFNRKEIKGHARNIFHEITIEYAHKNNESIFDKTVFISLPEEDFVLEKMKILYENEKYMQWEKFSQDLC